MRQRNLKPRYVSRVSDLMMDLPHAINVPITYHAGFVDQVYLITQQERNQLHRFKNQDRERFLTRKEQELYDFELYRAENLLSQYVQYSTSP